jgi:hypothetical protein
MTENAWKVRPRAEYLRELPTLDVETPDSDRVPQELRDLARRHGVDYVLELKLETPAARYWLCTKGLPGPRAWGLGEAADRLTAPEAWVEGYVTVEPVGDGESHSYGPDQAGRLQALDYLNLLREERDRLDAECARGVTPEAEAQLRATRKEIRQVVKRLTRKGNPQDG